MNRIESQKAFTLIELLIVIGILAVLATTVLLVINPAQLVKQSRDANRITEINQINKALLLFQSFGGSSTAMGNSNTIYISLPDTDSQCGSYYGQLTATTTGWNYHCSTSANYRNIDGTGWIPVDLSSIQGQAGTLFSNLPIDPIQASDLSAAATNGYYYTYIHGSWALSATMESDKYLAANASSDGGQSSTRFEAGNELNLNKNLYHVPTNGLIAYWNFDENSGNIAYDELNTNNGTLINNPTWSTGVIGSAINLDGINDYIDIGAATSLVGMSALTLEFWINPTIDQSNKGILGWSGDYNDAWGIFIYPDNLLFRIKTTSGVVTLQPNSGDVILNTGEWTHIALVYDGSKMYLYRNGVLKGPTPTQTGTIIRGAGSTATIGTFYVPTNFCFNGLIDEFAVYNRALSTIEILSIYNTQK